MAAELPERRALVNDAGFVPPPIVAATTSDTAILGTFAAGPLDEAVLVRTGAEFLDAFGDSDRTAVPSLAACAVSQFFANGGERAWIVRLPAPDGAGQTFADAALIELGAATGAPRLDAIAPEMFNLMCIPEAAWLPLGPQHSVLAAALSFCEQRGAMLLVDAPPPSAAYVPVRRLAAFIEHSIDQSTRWAVFEPNEEALWAQLRLVVGQFMNALFRQSAFQGSTPADAFFVRCDATTSSVQDIQAGVLNVLVGFAPLRPAEFVELRIAVRAAVTPPQWRRAPRRSAPTCPSRPTGAATAPCTSRSRARR